MDADICDTQVITIQHPDNNGHRRNGLLLVYRRGTPRYARKGCFLILFTYSHLSLSHFLSVSFSFLQFATDSLLPHSLPISVHLSFPLLLLVRHSLSFSITHTHTLSLFLSLYVPVRLFLFSTFFYYSLSLSLSLYFSHSLCLCLYLSLFPCIVYFFLYISHPPSLMISFSLSFSLCSIPLFSTGLLNFISHSLPVRLSIFPAIS
ncbi:ANO10 [Acanthosepion pharaonis]|uniref:ANO10 n=1 Tax=Acanthosepion pharaonis TaxID=158019 RepID=A0A812EN24_ACAPH|nr:ANO10 [Sepia pharaonis]